MKSLRSLFARSKDEVWRELSKEIGAEFVDGGMWHGNKVVAKVKHWTLTLDTYTVSTGHTHITYTRMRAPYVNMDGFRFTIYRRGMLSGLGKFLGMQDIEEGYPEFDEAFIIKSTDESRVRTLLGNAKIRMLIQAQPSIHLQVKDDEGWFGADFPKGVDELIFQVVGVIEDVNRLKALYELFAEVLNQLCLMGSAYEDDPRVNL